MDSQVNYRAVEGETWSMKKESWLGSNIDTIDYVHGIGNRKLTLYIRVRPPMHFLYTFGSWKNGWSLTFSRFRRFTGPKDTSNVSTKAYL